MKFGKWITNREKDKITYTAPFESKMGYEPFDRRGTDLYKGDGLVAFRKKFTCNEATKILLRITALGVFEAYINGQRIGSRVGNEIVFDEMKPGWTDYRYHVMEFEYDVTEYCHRGENILVIPVANGWWSGRISKGIYGLRGVGICGEIEKRFEDGRCEFLATGEDWETAIGGRIRTAEIWAGEYYDALEKDITAESSAYTWRAADPYEEIDCEIIPHIGEPVRIRQYGERPRSAVIYNGTDDNGSDFGELHVTSRHAGNGCEWGSLMKGEHLILDMGYNRTARPRIRLSSARGTTVKIYCAEMLNDSGEKSRGNDGPKGSLYLDNYRSALSRIHYITGGGSEEYSPLYSFYGFRYLEICADNDIEIIEVAADIIGSDLYRTGSIETDNTEVNRLIGNIVRGLDSNYLSVPTDCPQRDERLGWTGDTQIFCGAAAYFDNAYSFLRKWCMDLRDSQDEDGALAFVAPNVFGKDYPNYDKIRSAAAWSDAIIIVPYKMWLMYGRTEILEENFDTMIQYMDYIQTTRGYDGPSPAFGDWLGFEDTPKSYVSVCYYAYDALLMSKICHILGREETAKHYETLFLNINNHYRQKYTDGEGNITVTTQTGYLLPLAFDMLEGEDRQKAIKALHEKIKGNDYTLSTGFVGTGLLCNTLSEIGLTGDAYSLLLQTRNPSWLYSVRAGATTVWERWDSYTTEHGFGKVEMNSFNHYSYGAVAEWMFTHMAGIRPNADMPGFRSFYLAPCPDTRDDGEIPKGQSRIRAVKAEYLSVCGLIRAAWEYENDRFVYLITIPEGARAKIRFPLLYGQNSVEINGLVFTEGGGFTVQDETMCFELGAGTYEIR
jgi:alpha-L-rhamnosidase